VNEDVVEALAEAAGLPLPAGRARAVAELLEALTRDDGGGVGPDKVSGVEPATAFDPVWPA
jgi:hypothetical protein